jgi:hypothetical protein
MQRLLYQDLDPPTLSSHTGALIQVRLEFRHLGRDWCHFSLFCWRRTRTLLHLRSSVGILDVLLLDMGWHPALCRWPVDELLQWHRLGSIRLLCGCAAAGDPRIHRASHLTETKMGDLSFLPSRNQVCGKRFNSSIDTVADYQKCCSCWHRKDVLARRAWSSSGHLLDWRRSPYMVRCRNAVGNHLRLRSFNQDDIRVCVQALAQLRPTTPAVSPWQPSTARKIARWIRCTGECEEFANRTGGVSTRSEYHSFVGSQLTRAIWLHTLRRTILLLMLRSSPLQVDKLLASLPCPALMRSSGSPVQLTLNLRDNRLESIVLTPLANASAILDIRRGSFD